MGQTASPRARITPRTGVDGSFETAHFAGRSVAARDADDLRPWPAEPAASDDFDALLDQVPGMRDMHRWFEALRARFAAAGGDPSHLTFDASTLVVDGAGIGTLSLVAHHLDDEELAERTLHACSEPGCVPAVGLLGDEFGGALVVNLVRREGGGKHCINLDFGE